MNHSLERLLFSQEASTSGRAPFAPPLELKCSCIGGQRLLWKGRRLSRPADGGRREHKQACGPLRAVHSDEIPLPYTDQDYTPRGNSEYWSLRPVTVLQRSLQIGFAFVGWYLVTRLRGGDGGRNTQAERMRGVLTELGPAFVKIGQAISSRPDLVPPSYTRELEKLQDKIPPFADSDALLIIQQELGLPANQLFSDISPTAVAAASLGQVYKARLRRNGQQVAVKVQRPGVREAIALDVFIMRFLAGQLRQWRKLNSDLPALLDEWAASLFRELDYRREAANGTHFKQLYSHLKGIYIPDMLEDLTTQRVLTMEWLDGVRLRSAGEDPSAGRALDPQDMKLVGYGVQCSLEQMLEDGFYHADPHPGNLLRTADGRLGYLDFGMMASIDPKIRRGLIRATLHMVNREFQALAADFETLGLLPPGSDRDQVVPALSGVFEKALAGGVANMSFGSLSGDLGRTMYEFQFRIPPYYTLLVRSLSVLEGIALSSDPNYKVLGAAYPWVARRLLTNANPELQQTLRALLYKDGRFQFSRLESLLLQALKSPARASRDGPRLSTPAGDKPIEFLLGSEGAYVRDIVVEELAKGLDAAWRLAADDARVQLSDMLKGGGLLAGWRAPSGTAASNSPSAVLLSALTSFPTLADEADTYQVEGIMKLVAALQQVNGSAAAAASQSSMLPGRVSQAVEMLRWFVLETQKLPAPARLEALRLPLAVGAKLSSRIGARALKAILTSSGTQNGRQRRGDLPSAPPRRSTPAAS